MTMPTGNSGPRRTSCSTAEEHLLYRDSRFIGKTGAHGEKIFWGRGNGWVLAGLANILRELRPGDPLREKYVNLFVELADRVASLQRPDGFWSTSLLAPPDVGHPKNPVALVS